jgi:hypothetical protein
MDTGLCHGEAKSVPGSCPACCSPYEYCRYWRTEDLGDMV